MDSALNLINSFVYIVGAVYNSTFFAVVKFLLGIYVVVVFVDIILLLWQRGLKGEVRETLLGMNVPPELVRKRGKTKLKKEWEKKVKMNLRSPQENDWKVAVIQADEIIDRLLDQMKFMGGNITERLDAAPPGKIEDAENLRSAHEIRNKIIGDTSFSLTREEAEKAVANFEEFLITHEILE